MASEYPTAPELPHKIPQLVRDGKTPETAVPPVSVTSPNLPDEADEEPIEELDELNEHVTDPGDPDGVVAAENQKDWRDDYQAAAAKPQKKKRRWPLVLLVVLLVAVAAGATYVLTSEKAAAPADKTTQHQTSSAAKKHTDVPTKAYTSDAYALSFNYPEDWTLNDDASKLTVTSPVVSLTDSTGAKNYGRVVISVQNQQSTIPNYPADGAVAVLSSDKLTYKQPTQVQRAQTYLSYLGYRAAGLDALYITGDNGYQKDQTVPMSDVVKGNPLISVTYTSCSDKVCQTTGAPLTLQTDSWSTTVVSKQVTALLESLQLN